MLCWFACGCDTFADANPDLEQSPSAFGGEATTSPGSLMPSTPSRIVPGASAGRTPSGGRAGTGSSTSTVAKDAGLAPLDDDASTPFGDELAGLCSAPLPTGYCIERLGSTQTQNNRKFSGTSVTLTNYNPNDGSLSRVTLSLTPDGTISTGNLWTFTIATIDGEELVPGLYAHALGRRSLNADPAVQLSVSTSPSCFDQLGRFRLDEMATDARGKLSRLSVAFETRCLEQGRESELLRGVVHYQANGTADPSPVLAKTLMLSGDVSRVVYAPATHRVYGLDANARKLSIIDLTSGDQQTREVIQVPDAACVDQARARLVVVNKGSSIISEYGLDDLMPVREYSWAAADANPAGSHFQVYCAGDKLYLLDAAAPPGLSVVESLAAERPTVEDHSAQISGVTALAFKSDHSEFYTWFQEAGGATSDAAIRRHAANGLSQLDQTPEPSNDPLLRGGLSSPLLLDERRGLLIAKTALFDAQDLSKRIYTLPELDTLALAHSELAYALDAGHGWLATRRYVYELDRYTVVSRTATTAADQMFFDHDGLLWYLNTAKHTLSAQVIAAE